jgi:hypothetical protein
MSIEPDLMTPARTVRRIMVTGTVWFAAAILSVAIFIGPLMASGWRPSVLSGGVENLFWIGSVIVALSLGLIGWSGCPILEHDVPTADRNKTRTMQLGVLSFILGSTATVFAVLLSPVA